MIDQLALHAIEAVRRTWACAVPDLALDVWWAAGDRARVYAVARARADSGWTLAFYRALDPDADAARAIAREILALRPAADLAALLSLGGDATLREAILGAVTYRETRSLVARIFDGRFDPAAYTDPDAAPRAFGCARLPERAALFPDIFANAYRPHDIDAILLALHAVDGFELVPEHHRIAAARVAALAGNRALVDRMTTGDGAPISGVSAAQVAWPEVVDAWIAPIRKLAEDAELCFEEGLVTAEERDRLLWAAARCDGALGAKVDTAALAAHLAAGNFATALLSPPPPTADAPPPARLRKSTLDAVAAVAKTPRKQTNALRVIARAGGMGHAGLATEALAALEAITGSLAGSTEFGVGFALAHVPGRAHDAAGALDDYSPPYERAAVAAALARDGDRAAAEEHARRVLAEPIGTLETEHLLQVASIALRPDTTDRARLAELVHGALADLPTTPDWPLVRAATLHAAARSPALEAQLAADPDDAATLLVYANFLVERGDPRGELIALHHHRRNAEAALLLARHPEHFLGELATYATALDGTDEPVFAWRDGFLARARLGFAHEVAQARAHRGGDLAEAVALVLDHPSGALLRELVLAVALADAGWDLAPAIAALARADRPALRTLQLGEFAFNGASARPGVSRGMAYEISWARIPDLRALWLRLPNLRHLAIQGDLAHDVIGDLAPLAHLETLTLRSGGLGAENLRAIAAAPLPALTTLELWCGQSDYGFTGDVADFAPILAGANLPALRTLRLMNCELADQLVVPLARSAILRRLTTLGLAMGTLTDDGARLLREHHAAFAHLELLELDDNCLTDPGTVQWLAREVWCDTSKDPDTERYASVGE